MVPAAPLFHHGRVDELWGVLDFEADPFAENFEVLSHTFPVFAGNHPEVVFGAGDHLDLHAPTVPVDPWGHQRRLTVQLLTVLNLKRYNPKNFVEKFLLLLKIINLPFTTIQ